VRQLFVEGENVLTLQLHNNWLDAEMSINPYLSFGLQTDTTYFSEPPGWFFHDGLHLHTNFSLAVEGEPLMLFDADGNLQDAVDIPELTFDISYGRSADGGADFCFFANPSPDSSNNQQQCLAGIIQELPVFSPDAGLHNIAPDDSLLISIFSLCPDCSIRFTQDGSDPDENSPLYQQSIYLTGTTVIKARLFREGYLPGSVAGGSFIINKNTKLPVISISTEPDLLFSDENGIYVLGPNASGTFPYYGANFWRDVEIPVSVEYFGTGDRQIFQQEAGLQIHGGWSRAFDQKSLRLTARSCFGPSEFKHPFFKDKNILNYKKLILRNGGNDFQAAMMRDALMHKIVQNKTNLSVQDYLPAVVYLNGEYWGIHNMREKIDKYFLYENFDLDDLDVDLLENNNLVISGDNKDFLDLYSFIVTNDLSDAGNYQTVCDQLEITNLIDYFVVEIFTVNTDWPQNNVKYWRHGDGKWQYILLDLDNAMGFINSLQHHSTNAYERILQDSVNVHSIIFQNLMDNNTFRRDFVNRYADLLNTIFLPENSFALIDAIRDSIVGEMEAHKNKWGGSVTLWVNYHVNNRLKTFFQYRSDFTRDHTVEVFELDTIFNLCLKTKNSHDSRIRINSIIPDKYPWDGIYFYDNPVLVEALPAPGMAFSHWETTDHPVLQDSLARMWWRLTGDDTLTAHFTGTPDTLKLLFTEINFKSHERMDAGDWVELYNPNEVDLNISGWILKGDSDFSAFIFPENTIVPAGEYWIVAQDTSRFSEIYQHVNNLSGPFVFGLKSWSSKLRLFDEHDNPIVSMQYYDQAPWPEDIAGSGRTIELISTEESILDPANWRTGCLGGSPGEKPRECREEFNIAFTEFNYKSNPNFDTDDWVEIYNYDTATVDLSHWVFKDDDGSHRFHLPFGTLIEPGSFLVICEDTAAFRTFNPEVAQVIGNFDFGLSSESDMVRLFDPWENPVSMIDYTASAPWPTNISGTGRTAEVIDHTANSNDPSNWRSGCLGGSPGKFPLPCHDTAAIVVTEINYAASGNFNTGDWIEIFNNDSVPVSLNGWRFRDNNSSHNFYFPDDLVLMPEEYLLVVEDSLRFSAVHDTISGIIGNFDFGLSSSADEVHLYDGFEQQIAFISYTSSAPWPEDIPGSDRTIELIDPYLAMNDPVNWKAGCFGGSPGSAPFDCTDNYKIAFTEFNYKSHPSFNTEDWVELHNYDSVTVDLGSWVFKDENDANIFVFPTGTLIGPGEFLVICQDTAAFRQLNSEVVSVTGNFSFGLSSQNDQLRLFDAQGYLILLVEYLSDYPWPQEISGTGRTAEVIDHTANLNDGTNWRAGCLGGSPGNFFQACHDTAAIVVTEINYNAHENFDTGAWFEILNNDTIPVSLAGWSFHDADANNIFHFPADIELNPGDYLVVAEDLQKFQSVHDTIMNVTGSFGFALSDLADEIHIFDLFGQQIVYISYQSAAPWPETPPGSGRTIQIIDPETELNDPLNWKSGCPGGSPGAPYSPCPPTPAIVISEIYYDASQDFGASTWFEIYNNDTVSVSLDGWRFHNADENNMFLFPDGIGLMPGDYYVVVEDSADFLLVHDTIQEFTGSYGFALSDLADELYLFDTYNQQIASLSYQSTAPWPELEAGEGHTIELIDPGMEMTDPANWRVGCPGGSPGVDSVACDDSSVPEALSELLTINVYPNPFNQQFTIRITAKVPLHVDFSLKICKKAFIFCKSHPTSGTLFTSLSGINHHFLNRIFVINGDFKFHLNLTAIILNDVVIFFNLACIPEKMLLLHEHRRIKKFLL